ncbi:patatin-like phospholipase family protein [Atopomonas sediminilitoris]|uniref:patatin-like phospholipase family protein n=1 Tax=Atopomonas sediminilitoris TaxID=2919919 RepID=UPI001F4E4FB6|nr:patatin-like phospholipase family protein [Atopomonas sediminilitoris]MCJ8170859.1 patatin-like phospholipase family protein [Atopomonas sediminilitoris]
MPAALHLHSPSLTLRAGPRALARIREQGLQASDVHIIPAAAGGPKGLGIQGLDFAVFGEFLPRAPQVRALVGASIGSWRMASACMRDPVAAFQRLGERYTAMSFPKGLSLLDVTQRCSQMLDELLEGEEDFILQNPHYRLNIMVNRTHGHLQHDQRGRVALGLAAVVGNNLLARPRLARHFDRVIAHDPRQAPPLTSTRAPGDFTSEYLALDAANLRPALLASGSIPLVMHGVRDIPGAGPGMYRDGGLLDYHLDLPYAGDGIVLYPHFTDRIIPGWFDKSLPWRNGCPQRLQDVLLLSPSAHYLQQLPHGKLPDRGDFRRYLGDDAGRQRYWQQAMRASQRMGDELLELIATGRLAERLQPLR